MGRGMVSVCVESREEEESGGRTRCHEAICISIAVGAVE